MGKIALEAEPHHSIIGRNITQSGAVESFLSKRSKTSMLIKSLHSQKLHYLCIERTTSTISFHF
jgi:hypothetical protein